MNVEDEYISWICSLVCDRHHSRTKYRKLLNFLYDSDFMWINDKDVNRANDGINLRYRFAYEQGYSNEVVNENIDRYCNVLEMMVALAFRVEEEIMSDPDIGDRTSVWFWMMIDNLGLLEMTNDNFDNEKASEIISRFLNRDYEPDGNGGLIVLEHCKYDLRDIEIWYQMMWYLTEHYS